MPSARYRAASIAGLTVAAMLTGVVTAPLSARQEGATLSLARLVRESLEAAKKTMDAQRAMALVTLYSAVKDHDARQASVVLDEAAEVAGRLPPRDRSGSSLRRIVQMDRLLRGLPPDPILAELDRREAAPPITSTLLTMAEQLAPVHSARAFALAASISTPTERARGFESVGRAWNAAGRAALLQLVRDRAALEVRERAAVPLSGLARAVSFDATAARELAHRSLEVRRLSEIGALDATYVYETLAMLDPQRAQTELDRLIGHEGTDELRLAYAAGILASRPESAWRALKAATRPDDTDKRSLARLAGILRALSSRMPAEYRDELKAYALDLHTRASAYGNPFYSFSGPSPLGVVAAIDTVATLGRLDPVLARSTAEATKFPPNVTRMVLMRTRIGAVENLSTDLLRLESALWQLESTPEVAFPVLESFDQAFWEAFAGLALRWSGTAWPANTGPAQGFDQLRRVRERWPATARAVCVRDPATCRRTLVRFRQTAAWLDRVATDQIADDPRQRALWADYLPFSLANAAEALAVVDPKAADEAVQESLKLALKQSTGARMWALAWNAVAWRRIDSTVARSATSEAVKRLGVPEVARAGREWWEWSAPFLQQVARLDAPRAYAIARASDPIVRAAALAAVAAGLTTESESPTP
jgi:hypothetical protein